MTHMEVTRNGIRYQVGVRDGEMIVTPPMVGSTAPVPLVVAKVKENTPPNVIKKMAVKALRGIPAPQPRV